MLLKRLFSTATLSLLFFSFNSLPAEAGCKSGNPRRSGRFDYFTRRNPPQERKTATASPAISHY
jgi:hypothetical protein